MRTVKNLHNPMILDELAQTTLDTIKQSEPVIGFSWDISLILGFENCTGFTGRVWLRFSEKPTNAFKMFDSGPCRIKNGGIGLSGPWYPINSIRYKHQKFTECYPYNWQLHIPLDQLPLIQKYLNHQKLMHQLKEPDKIFSIQHEFTWLDPLVEQQDQLIINSLTKKDLA